MQLSALNLSQLIGGTVEGDPNVLISGPSKIEEGKPGTVTFLGNLKYEQYIYTTLASVVIVDKTFSPKQAIHSTLIRVDDVYVAVAKLLEQFGQSLYLDRGISEQAQIDPSAKIGEDTSVGDFVQIGPGVEIGNNCNIYPNVFIGQGVRIQNNSTIYPGVRIMHQSQIGNNCIIHCNAVIGCDGFGFAPQPDGSYQKIIQAGNVIIEDYVEIGANTCIDRGSMGATIIRTGVKLDNLIHIAHNVEIEANTVIAAQAGIAGSTKIGKNCQIGGQVGFVGHVSIADGTQIQAQSGIATGVKKPNSKLFGSPAIDYQNYLKSYSVFKNLPSLYRQIHQLEKRIKELEKNNIS